MKEMILDKLETRIEAISFILRSSEFNIPETNRKNLEVILASLEDTYMNGLESYDNNTLIEYDRYLERVSEDLYTNYGVSVSSTIEDIEPEIVEDSENIQRVTVIDRAQTQEEYEQREEKKKGCLRNTLIGAGLLAACIFIATNVNSCQQHKAATLALENQIKHMQELEEEQNKKAEEEAAKAAKAAKEAEEAAKKAEEEAAKKAKEDAAKKAEEAKEETTKVTSVDLVDFENITSIRSYAEYLKATYAQNIEISVDEIVDALIINNIDQLEIKENGQVVGYNHIEQFDSVEKVYDVYENTIKLAEVASDKLLVSNTRGYYIEASELEDILAKHGASDQLGRFVSAKQSDGKYDLTKVFDVFRLATKEHNYASEAAAKAYNEAFARFVVDNSSAVADGPALYLGSIYSADLKDTAAETVGYWNSIIYGVYRDENGNVIDMDGVGGWICSEELMNNYAMYETTPYADHTIAIDEGNYNENGFEYLMADYLVSLNRNRQR